MESLIALLIEALNRVGIRACAAFPYRAAPRLKAALTTVRIARAEAKEGALGRHLGMREDAQRGCVETSGVALGATVSFRVATPAVGGGAACFTEANALMDVLLMGIDGISIGEFTQSACSYARELDQFECVIQAEITAWLLPETRAEQDEPMLGEIVVRHLEEETEGV